jgi:hypothetical protein
MDPKNRGARLRRPLPLLGSNQDSPDPESGGKHIPKTVNMPALAGIWASVPLSLKTDAGVCRETPLQSLVTGKHLLWL